MPSFFSKNKVSKPNCPKCGLDKLCNSPRMEYTGEGAKGILIIGEAPKRDEDRAGVQFVSKPGQRFKTSLKKLGVDLRKDCWSINAINCRTINEQGGDILPTPKQIGYCRPMVTNAIKELKPKKIFLLGTIAITAFYGDRTSYVTHLGHVMGRKIWDAEYNAWVYPLWNAEFVAMKEKDNLIQAEHKRCLTRAVEGDTAPLQKKWNPIHKLIDFKTAMRALRRCLQNDRIIAIDYETTGLDMYKEGHKTVSFAWANSEGSWAVPVDHPYWKRKQQEKIRKIICKILSKRKIKKIVHNLTFEYQWTKQQMGVEPRSFFWDTQLSVHVVDNRPGITKLKHQCFTRWGIGDYDKDASKYIKTNPKTGYNDMLKMPVDALLEYNALDTLYTYELYKENIAEFEGRELKAYQFFHRGALALCEMSCNGISINEAYYLDQKAELEAERSKLISDIVNSEEATKYRKKYGTFNYDSPQHLQKMLFNVLGLKSVKETKSGGASVDEEVLQKIGIPLTQNIVAVRKLNKMIGTYVDGIVRHANFKKLHPYFSLTRARSYRGSSSNPNFQNLPKRDPKANRVVRSGMVPRKGCVLGEMDFSGAEIATSAFYHKDPTFIEYQLKEGADMHRDACANILKITPEEVREIKPARQATKGIWTFSQFYGSYYVSCAKQGWEEYPLVIDKQGKPIQIRGMDIGDWMIKTFGTYKAFENHLKKFENTFWNDWFKVYTDWKKEIVRDYVKSGYVETFLGFRFKGSMDSKQCTNYPIQGTSFHLLLHTAYEFWRATKIAGLKTKMIGQIHDSLILDIPVEEIDEVTDILTTIVGTLHETFDWMAYPMGMDFELSEPREEGGSFAKMSEVSL